MLTEGAYDGEITLSSSSRTGVGTATPTTRVAACVAGVAAGERYGWGACEGDTGGEGDAVDLRGGWWGGDVVVGGTHEHMNT